MTPAVAHAAAALDRRTFLRLAGLAAAAGLVPTGCGGGQAPAAGTTLQVLSSRQYATLTAAAARLVGPRGAALIRDRAVDPAAAADALLARSPLVGGLVAQALTVLEFGVWPLLPKLRPFTALDDDAQDALLRDCMTSSMDLKQALFAGVRGIVMGAFYGQAATQPLTHYPGPFGLGAVTIADAMQPLDEPE
ncbi:MAG: hypothetical protein KIT14_04135 [bacterium]|nr:hypothetical protein [bacterium]